MPNTNINIDLFRRFSPEHKKEIVNSLTIFQLSSIEIKTIERIIKEIGSPYEYKHVYNENGPYVDKKGRKYKIAIVTRSSKKEVFISNRVGNEWNSCLKRIYINKDHKVMMLFYIQGDDIDTECSFPLSSFLDTSRRDITVGKLHEEFSNGYAHDVPANYSLEDRARVIKGILLEYIERKYKNKTEK